MIETIRLKPMGLIKDMAPQDVPPDKWTDGYNVIFEDGRARKSKGYNEIPTSVVPYVMEYFTDGNVDYWIYCSPTGVEAWDGASFTDLTPAGWGGEQVSICDINGFPVISDGSPGGLYHWDFVAGTFLDYPGWDSSWSCGIIRSAKYHLIALDVEDGSGYRGTYGRYSDVAAPGNIPATWVPAADNLAGDFYLATPEGRMIDGGPLRDDFIVFKENSAAVLRYIGGQFQWTVNDVFRTVGCLAPQCVVEHENKMFVITQDDIVVTDGVNVETIADQQIKHAFFDNIDPELANRCYMQTDRDSEQLYIAFPDRSAVDGCNRMFIYSYSDQTWTERLFLAEHYCGAIGRYSETGVVSPPWNDMNMDWNTVTGAWNPDQRTVSKNRIVLGSANGLWQLGNFDQDNGANIPVRMEKTGIFLGAIDRQKMITRLWPRFAEGAGVTVQIRVGSSQDTEDPIQWGPVTNFVIGQDRFIPVTGQGRVGAVRVESVGAGQWALTGIDMDVRPQGRY